MSRIVITDSSVSEIKKFDATNTTVLIPILRKGAEGSEEVVNPDSTIVYRTVADFTADFGTICDFGTSAEHKYDDNYFLIQELITLGFGVLVLPVVGEALGSQDINAYATTEINSQLAANSGSILADYASKNLYNFKYVSTGTHANLLGTSASPTGCYANLVALAKNRGDAVALIDAENGTEPTIASPSADYSYACITYPWCRFSIKSAEKIWPGSVAYLFAAANTTQLYKDYYAIAGVDYGTIPNLIKPLVNVTEAKMHAWQGDSSPAITNTHINVVMNVGGDYGYKLWGNRPVRADMTKNDYFNFLNVRIILCDIKKQIQAAATRVMYSPNDEVTWNTFLELVNKVLSDMCNNRGLEWYRWTKNKSDFGTISAKLTIKPTEAVEAFVIDIFATDTGESEVTEQENEI